MCEPAVDTLYLLFEQLLLRAAESGARSTKDVLAYLGIDMNGIIEGGYAFKQTFPSDPQVGDASVAFAYAFAVGRVAGIRLAATAAASPVARGHEAQLFGLLLSGYGIEAALAGLKSTRHERSGTSGTVVPLRSRSSPREDHL